ncbi:uncharacterized protein LOC127944602 isoform X3 [Carassius gibelio]|uniref:uncharacterized protein LOC127944602 isoform X3 n=1 Tax=Carassius gibelio TaxID=101364 RepID=UPI002278CD62|nr:uncharacterized protein LOC127944602 isoform X3 [Carassius gibelio]XP_052396614.1 uncharacterized protein LOC127944602 isoform X3 [Carassius gibelio]
MRFLSLLLVSAVSVVFCVAELKLEATAGDNVTISFRTAELEGADKVRIIFTRDDQKKLIAHYFCFHHGDCHVEERAGVSLRIEEGVFTLLNVSSESSGLYEAQVFNGKDVPKKTVTLVVKPQISSSRSPPQTSTSQPPQTSTSQPPQTSISERRRIYALIALVLFLGVLGVLGVCFFYKNMRTPHLQKPNGKEIVVPV